ncbi:MAG: dTDP-glucose 4,6-dehydratase [Acidobacteriaceae bacterium]|nr:dTDP-glucose 4,6-dehydratase [Acidobacteriaceae bacterium]MBV9781133.1 dTDP-glucose 4,6-dehydratase [Acidobacteriaceae bacterium]
MKLVVTGGAGFIGSCFVRLALRERWAEQVINLDKLTYAGNLENVTEVSDHPGYSFVQADICDEDAVNRLFATESPDAVIHFAAESHVDRSIHSPDPVIRTNVNGTFTLLEAARRHRVPRFIHVSTDEVYGSVDPPHEADEGYPLHTSSPYSASKAGSDLLALSYHTTYKLNVSVTRASNNYGPFQFPEKLIPLMISNALEDKPLPVYGDGQQVRDWLYVEDHCRAVFAVLEKGALGEIYNIGGNCSLPNIEVVRRILKATGKPESLITRVADRPGHDRRYALTNAKLTRQTGWHPRVNFDTGLMNTIEWYRRNQEWVRRIKTGEYRHFYELNYTNRARELA